MKNFLSLPAKVLVALLLCTVLLLGCNKGESAEAEAFDEDTSYAFGMLAAAQMGQMGLIGANFNYDSFSEGFSDFNQAKETRLTPQQADEKINAAMVELQAKMNEEIMLMGEKNLQEGADYMAENANRGEVTTTASGLQYEVVTQGSGAQPTVNDTVVVNYEGKLIDGTVFDSSYTRGEPAEFPVNAVIPGWTEGLQLMNEGSVFNFVIPGDLAYGPGGSQSIPPNATLIFRVELITVKNTPAEEAPPASN